MERDRRSRRRKESRENYIGMQCDVPAGTELLTGPVGGPNGHIGYTSYDVQGEIIYYMELDGILSFCVFFHQPVQLENREVDNAWVLASR
jgi:hypothetical protein